jgi:hypothetical protein
MNLTEQEIEMVETLRGLSEHRVGQLTAILKDGYWECELITTPHPLSPGYSECPPNAIVLKRGVGTSFVEAFSNLDGNDIEPLEDVVD